MRVAMTVVLLLSAYLALRLSAEMDTTRSMQAEMQGLRSRLLERSKVENFELQAKCADQAEKVFQGLGYKRTSDLLDHAQVHSHYNPSLNKCFMTVEYQRMFNTLVGTGGQYLLDAYEKRQYAEFGRSIDMKGAKAKTDMTSCKTMPPAAAEKSCATEDEYKAFVAHYIE